MRLQDLKRVDTSWRKYSERDFKKRFAAESDTQNLIDGPCAIYADGEIAAVLLFEQDFLNETRNFIVSYSEWINGVRGSGVSTSTMAVGNQPRAPARSKEACMCSAVGYRHPDEHRKILEHATMAEKIYESMLPEIYSEHKIYSKEKILPEWRINKGVFTSGVINKNCSMGYHRDRGNIKNGWSAMYMLRDQCSGGFLSIIDLDTRLYLPDRSLLLFNGQKYMHGVTPIKKNKASGYRYSIVFYTLENMKSCLPQKEEISRAKIKRTEREMRRAGLIV